MLNSADLFCKPSLSISSAATFRDWGLANRSLDSLEPSNRTAFCLHANRISKSDKCNEFIDLGCLCQHHVIESGERMLFMLSQD